MLREIELKEGAADTGRRWFTDDYFELILWLDEKQRPQSFQLCYDRSRNERALTWSRASGLRHVTVDPGESSPLKNRAPILREGGVFDKEDILRRFESASALVPQTIAAFVKERINEARG